MGRRVVITGMGAVTPIGNSVPEFWENARAGTVGIDVIKRFDPSEYKATLAAEVKDFDPDERYITKKEMKRMDPFCQFAMCAAGEALDDSGLDPEYVRGNSRVGVIIGSGIGGLGTLQEQVTRLVTKGPGKVAPLFIPMAIGNMTAGNIAIKHGITGSCSSVVTACASSNNCIGEAFRGISHGYADVMLAGGAEASITGIGIAGFASLTALSPSTDPKRASIPFDKDRNGFVMGEGAGVLVLEELEHALARNARIYAEVLGYGVTCDAYHMTSPDPEGAGAAAAMVMAMEEAGLAPEDISCVNAHGTSTQANDLAETMAIKQVFGEYAYQLPVTGSKSMFGHLLGAAGALEAIICARTLTDDFITPTMGFMEPGEGCDLNYVPGKGVSMPVKAVLSNSLGFGGHNAVICFGKWEGR